MPYGGGDRIDITLPAAADFSSHRYHIVTVDANGRGTIATANTDVPIGILQNAPDAADKPCQVRVAGISKVQMGAAGNEAALITANGEGYGTVTAVDKLWYVGVLLHAAGGSADIQDCLVRPGMVSAT